MVPHRCRSPRQVAVGLQSNVGTERRLPLAQIIVQLGVEFEPAPVASTAGSTASTGSGRNGRCHSPVLTAGVRPQASALPTRSTWNLTDVLAVLVVGPPMAILALFPGLLAPVVACTAFEMDRASFDDDWRPIFLRPENEPRKPDQSHQHDRPATSSTDCCVRI